MRSVKWSTGYLLVAICAGGGTGFAQEQARVNRLEYEGWRQYSVNCARCHGQDALPNPVAANLLVSLAADGPMDDEQKFVPVVNEGRSTPISRGERRSGFQRVAPSSRPARVAAGESHIQNDSGYCFTHVGRRSRVTSATS